MRPFGLQAQAPCDYRLELFDSEGDGWDNAVLTLVVDGESRTFTLNPVTGSGAFRAFDLPVADGDELRVSYTNGLANQQNSYALYDSEGQLLFADGPRPESGEVFTTQATCPSCPAPSSRLISIDDVRDDRADISFVPPDPSASYILEYGLTSFPQGTGQEIPAGDGMVRIPALMQQTTYDFYLFAVCTAGDTSAIQGPFTFTTLWARDVGISSILEPFSACGLPSNDTVRVGLQNFGGKPQTLIPFRYAVNGEPANIPDPFDGLFTGVVGNDSTSFIDFETTTDLSAPGEYVITAWTELENDSDTSNDTTEVTITNIPIIASFPYFEDFEIWGGGWTVDSNSRRASWEHGQPVAPVISNAASGANAWVTNLSGPYNTGELSYLLSPCLDFSGLEAESDLRLSFRLFFQSESLDRAWVELSLDGAETWQKVGAPGTGINWYNDENSATWAGDASEEGWTFTQNTLENVGGVADARIRFVFESDNSTELEGFGIDDVFISAPLDRDLAAINVDNNSEEECGVPDDRIALRIANLGTATVSNFEVGYQIGAENPVIENVGNLSLAPGQETIYTFNASFNSAENRQFDVVAWTALSNDLFPRNDTTGRRINTVLPLPFAEDFESGMAPNGWDIGDAIVTGEHGNESFVLSDNLSVTNQTFEATTPAIGPLLGGDSLTFDYRFVLLAGDGANPKTLAPGERLEVQISTDCGANYGTVLTIDETTHQPTTALTPVRIDLDDLTGSDIKIRFLATWAAGNFFVDIDNVNILSCPASLKLAARVTDESFPEATDGSITIIPESSTGPYEYTWSTGDTTKTISNLSAGAYQVTVTDRFGCTDAASAEVGLITSLTTPDQIRELRLLPNPTGGISLLDLRLEEPAEVQVQVLSPMGQLLYQTDRRRDKELQYEIDLSRYPAGIYFLRIRVDKQLFTRKLMRME